MVRRCRLHAWSLLLLLLPVAAPLLPGQFPPSLWQSMKWRCIGPFRGGRTVGAVGIPTRPNVFYVGVNHGGVWKTTDFGRTWQPIFDDQPTGSIGDIALCEAAPDVLYVGSGEGLQRPDLSTGDGVYKSTDGGRTWKNVGLHDAQQIGAVAVDANDPKRVFVAALGHPYGQNEERGVFRSLDGGDTWQKVLYKNENTGAIAVAIDPKDPQVVYADLWESRQAPWENGVFGGPGSGLYKSIDGGSTWNQLTAGLPTIEQGLGRIGFAISRGNPAILYATVDADPQHGGIYRSDDAGASWRRISEDPRTWGRGSDFAEIRPDPRNPEVVYVANTAAYKSIDGGRTWKGFRGAPGGDDHHRIWINPLQPEIMLFATDQGAIVTVNGGETFSSWYNQPTAQFYHVITDDQYPYWVYGGQQESGSAGVRSRGDYGAVTWRDWRTIGVEEYGYVAPDPLDANIIYGGRVTRFDRRTGQVQNVGPERPPGFRVLRTAPLLFSPVDKKTLYFAGNVLFKTVNGGHSWETISPDLSREHPEPPANIGAYRTPELANMPRRGVIYALAPSHQNLTTIWAGTDDGLIQLTRDGGKTWKNVTPPELPAWAKVSQLDSSHFDDDTVYAAINTLRLDDLRPHVWRTHDGGGSWKEITAGLPDGATVDTVREDPVRKGLLYAGTERTVHVSFDDGEHWQPLRLNLPSTSIRDLVVHGDDLVAGTHGRSFWILDDVTPLRQITAEVAAAKAFLFQPQIAVRVRRSVNTDTPIPQEEPMGQNPPDGAILDYWLLADAKEVVLEIKDHNGKIVRRYASSDPPEPVDEDKQPYPSYWFRPARSLSAKAGMQRWVWDLHYPPPEGPRAYGMGAIYRDTPTSPDGPTALPGEYTAQLTVDGQPFTRLLAIRMDPRVVTPPEAIARQFEIALGSHERAAAARKAEAELKALRPRLEPLRAGATGKAAEALHAVDTKLAAIDEAQLAKVAATLTALMHTVEEADALPTEAAQKSWEETRKTCDELLGKWNEAKAKEVKALEQELGQQLVK